jgi:hypothetical protein
MSCSDAIGKGVFLQNGKITNPHARSKRRERLTSFSFPHLIAVDVSGIIIV